MTTELLDANITESATGALIPMTSPNEAVSYATDGSSLFGIIVPIAKLPSGYNSSWPLNDSYGTGRSAPNINWKQEPPEFSSSEETLAHARASLSLNIAELARILRVTRPTIYSWMAGTSSPREKHHACLVRIEAVCRAWDARSLLPIGRKVRSTIIYGKTLMNWLRDPDATEEQLLDVIRSFPIPERKKGNLESFAEKAGVVWSELAGKDNEPDRIARRRVHPK